MCVCEEPHVLVEMPNCSHFLSVSGAFLLFTIFYGGRGANAASQPYTNRETNWLAVVGVSGPAVQIWSPSPAHLRSPLQPITEGAQNWAVQVSEIRRGGTSDPVVDELG